MYLQFLLFSILLPYSKEEMKQQDKSRVRARVHHCNNDSCRIWTVHSTWYLWIDHFIQYRVLLENMLHKDSSVSRLHLLAQLLVASHFYFDTGGSIKVDGDAQLIGYNSFLHFGLFSSPQRSALSRPKLNLKKCVQIYFYMSESTDHSDSIGKNGFHHNISS